MYIYIEREREREREVDAQTQLQTIYELPLTGRCALPRPCRRVARGGEKEDGEKWVNFVSLFFCC